jgi:hypothetical protein
MRLIFVLAMVAFAQDSPKIAQAQKDLDRVREQAAAGLIPQMKVAEAQQTLDDTRDEDTLDRTLYAHLSVEDLTEQQSADMISAAQRRVDRVSEKLEQGKQLIAAGVAEPYLYADLESELARRRQVLDQAQSRAALIREIAEVAHAEVSEEPSAAVPGAPKEHFEGSDRLLDPKDIRDVTLAFEKQFHEPFPVSARGMTAVHRSLGFDHTGRMDVAVAPDSPEGVWLKKYLEARAISYYAFRVAMPGKATAPHIHIGPGSTRLTD